MYPVKVGLSPLACKLSRHCCLSLKCSCYIFCSKVCWIFLEGPIKIKYFEFHILLKKTLTAQTHAGLVAYGQTARQQADGICSHARERDTPGSLAGELITTKEETGLPQKESECKGGGGMSASALANGQRVNAGLFKNVY